MRQIVLDTETTGLDPAQGHRVVELACVEIENRLLTGRHLHLYLNPDRDSDPEALAVHGLTTEFLSAHPRFEEVAQQLVDFVKGAEVIIHNAAFDTKFLTAELNRCGMPAFHTLCEKVTDSLLHAREMHPGKRNSLDALCDRLEVDNSGRTLHGALLDAELLADVYINLTRGQEALIMAEEPAESEGGLVVAQLDLSSFRLHVVQANEQELAAHEDVLVQMDKSSGGKTIWRGFENQSQNL
jgi:DNA polymerase-3 subunit epsilon